MATVLDIGLLRGFTGIFVWLLVFIILYGGLEVTNLLKNKGLHALLAFVLTAVVVLTGGGTNLITAMVPWFVVMGALIFFVLLLSTFAGVDPKEVMRTFGGQHGKGLVWIIAIPMLIILVVAWTQSSGETAVDGSGAPIPTESRPFLGVLAEPKVLGLILVLMISVVTITFMAGGGSIVGGH